MKPAIIMSGYEAGRNNAAPTTSAKRVRASRAYEDCSTVCVVPTRGMVSVKVIESWLGLMTPMNHKYSRVFMRGFEVGAAYNQAINLILEHPELSTWKYVLTLEEDNLPPPDGLLKLIEAMGKHPEFDALAGLYWVKGEAGQPMIYGDPKKPLAFNPQVPKKDTVQECNGTGMGFTLFRMDTFRKVPGPWFETLQQWAPGKGGVAMTQDLFFFKKFREAGLRVASHNGVLVGHYSVEDDVVW